MSNAVPRSASLRSNCASDSFGCGGGASLTRKEVETIHIPTLIAVGTKDVVAGSPDELAALMPHAQVLIIPDRDHMLAVGDKV